MGKAEVGSTKYVANKMKSKGLTRLRWYCQICEKANRDENAFKMHSQSPSHVRKVQQAVESGQFRKIQEDYSKTFLKEFIELLRSGHGEKFIHINKFYQEVIARKDHTHLNSTKWHSLTDLAKYLGRESICRVEEKDDGLHIAWIDDSPETLKRKEAAKRKDLQNKGDEEREKAMLEAQILRARKDAEAKGTVDADADAKTLQLCDGEKVKLDFGVKVALQKCESTPPGTVGSGDQAVETSETCLCTFRGEVNDPTAVPDPNADGEKSAQMNIEASMPKPVPVKMGANPQIKNVFKSAFGSVPKKKKVMSSQPQRMSEAERIMTEELERKRRREQDGGGPKRRRA